MNLVILLFILFILFSFIYAGYRAAPWVPTRARDVNRVLNLAQIQPGQKFYDLGCGDARLVCAAARAGANAQGLEISFLPYLWGLWRVFRQKKSSKISFKDFWNTNLSDADVVYFFLMPRALKKLQTKLEKELKPGAKVISYTWPLPDWPEAKIDEQTGCATLYLYEK